MGQKFAPFARRNFRRRSPEASSLQPQAARRSAALEGGRGGETLICGGFYWSSRSPSLPPRRAAVLVIKLGQSEEGERPWEEMKLFFTMARQHVRLESDGRVGREDIELMEMPRTISISSSATAPVGRGRSTRRLK